MKKTITLLIICISIMFASCDNYELPNIDNSYKCTVLEVTDVTNESATILCKINMDDMNDVTSCGVYYAEDFGSIDETGTNIYFYGNKCEGKIINGNEFVVELSDLTKNTKYYYRAFICINDAIYAFGDFSYRSFFSTNFSSEPGSKLPDYVFSIEKNRYVLFSPGNLQYQASTKLWRFAPNQYDYIGEENENISSYYNGWIDLFGWGTGNNPTLYIDSDEYYSLYIDWGFNKIGNDEPETWRTLTSAEWKFLIHSRQNANLLNGAACLLLDNGEQVLGWILLPDSWKSPSGITFNSGCSNGYSTNVIREVKWKLMEAQGAIFLPAAEYRFYRACYNTEEEGRYWTSSVSNEPDYIGAPLFLKITENIFSSTYRYNDKLRYPGHSVRLVKDVVNN